MKKIFCVLLVFLLSFSAVGCAKNTPGMQDTPKIKQVKNDYIYEFIDNETGVHYLVYSYDPGHSGMGGITPRLNSDGSVMTEQTKANPAGNFYKINGIMRDIGDYKETEELFLADIYENYLPTTGISANEVFVYDSDELTEEMLENRKGTLIIERCIGIVTDKESGAGKILNANEGYDYIVYRNDGNISNGTVLLSYMLYNPNNNCIDDIIERYDFVICREYED